MSLLCFGLSHRTAGVEIRERFAVADCDCAAVLGQLNALPGVAEALIVSTCNRVEFYTACNEAATAAAAVREFLLRRAGNDSTTAFYKLDGAASVNHLFRVVCGLDSMVIGETEILGQVKKAYAAAAAAGTTARRLNKLFQRAFNVAKEVRTKTCITRGPVSVGSATVDLAERIFGELASCKVVLLGAGEISELTAKALRSRGVKHMVVSNRSAERAAALAALMGAETMPFEEWDRRLGDADILISSTAAPHAIVTRRKLAATMHQRPERPLFVIDLAVPRDVEPEVNELDGVYLYDIDSLQAIAQQGIETRRREIAACEALIERHVIEFVKWLEASTPGCKIPVDEVIAEL